MPTTTPALAVVPARWASARLPGKPLRLLLGRPLVLWVWERAVASGRFARVVVATDHPAVAEVVTAAGGEALLTRDDHPSGTDRLAEVVRRPPYDEFDRIVNVQGDEPFLEPAHFDALLGLLERFPLATLAAPLTSRRAWRSPHVVKVVRGDDGRALFFSRGPIPWPRDAAPDWASGLYLRHLGLYGYRRTALLAWAALPEHPLERIERLEQLRPLASGWPIGVAVVSAPHPGVDTPADLARAERRLRRERRRPPEHTDSAEPSSFSCP